MSRPKRSTPGFTLLEMMVVVAIIAILATMAALSLQRARPRANLAGAAVDLQALVHGARQQALASGNDVAVMVFPGYSSDADVVGRVVVYEDGDHTLFDPASADKFEDYDPAKLKAAAKSEVITSLDLPPAVRFGPATGMGAGAKLAAPWSAVPVDLDCTFCDGEGVKRRGALVFDSRGRARFYSKSGPALEVEGGSVSLVVPELGTDKANQIRTLAVGASNGAIHSLNNG